MSENPYITAATAADFPEKVIRRSQDVPVLVDFWAAWCGPCKALAPVLNDIVHELKGAVLLVTVDTDQEIELARRYQVRSLPTVKLFEGGDMVDEFMGALPASRVREFLEPYVVRQSDRQADRAAALARDGDLDGAIALFEQTLRDDPKNLKARLRYARAMLDAGDVERATRVLEEVPVASSGDPGVVRLKALLEFHGLVHPDQSDAQLEAGAAESSPAALRELAARKVLEGDYAAAMELQLRLLKSDRSYADNAAQKDMLAVFELAGDSDLVSSYRRRMANLLY